MPFRASHTSSGTDPKVFTEDIMRALVGAINSEATRLETELVEATPSGTSGRMRQGWVFTPATLDNPVATVGQSVPYFLPMELGRSPGKGISQKGQEEVMRWAKLVIGLEPKDQAGFAYALSEKYKKFGRPAVGFVGLARPGQTPSSTPNIPDDPIPGSLLASAFERIQNRLDDV